MDSSNKSNKRSSESQTEGCGKKALKQQKLSFGKSEASSSNVDGS